VDQRTVVGGGGLTGGEAASELTEAYPARTSCGSPSASSFPSVRRASRGTVLSAGVSIVATSFDVPDLVRVTGLAVDDLGPLRGRRDPAQPRRTDDHRRP
jgi:hypothetical protein